MITSFTDAILKCLSNEADIQRGNCVSSTYPVAMVPTARAKVATLEWAEDQIVKIADNFIKDESEV